MRLIAAALALFFSFGCITTEYDTVTHKQDIFFYSTKKEVAIGEKVARAVEEKYKLSADTKLNEKIMAIGEKLAKVCDRQEILYRFYVLDDKMVNAFSLPGGFVYISTGLLNILHSDDEIAFVLGHEIGHIVARHAIKRLQAALGYNLLILASVAAPSTGNFPQGVSLALASILSGYSQEDEFLADKLGIKYAQKAGFDPKAAIKVMKALEENNRKEPLHRIAYFRTHPYIPQRIRKIKEELGMPLNVNDFLN